MEVVNLPAAGTPLRRRNFDHPLSGEWNPPVNVTERLVLIPMKELRAQGSAAGRQHGEHQEHQGHSR